MKRLKYVFVDAAIMAATVAVLSGMPTATEAASAASPAAPAPRQGQGRGDPGPGLFSPVESDRVADVAPSDRALSDPRFGSPASGITTVRSRLVRVAADELAHTRASIEGGTPVGLTLNFFDDAVFQIVFEETRVTWTGGYSLLGRLDEGTSGYGGTAALVVSDGVVRGTVRTAGGTYAIAAMEDGVHVIRQIDLSRGPVLGDDVLRGPRGRDVPEPPEDAPSSPPRSNTGSSRIDVVVVYSPEARRDLGGSSSTAAARVRMVEKIEDSVADTNSALRAGGLPHRIQLVYVGETDHFFSERADATLTLHAFRDDATVGALRELYRADLAHLIVRGGILNSKGDRICGLGYEPGHFALTAADCLSPDLTFTHELGHNFGLSHDPYQLGEDNVRPHLSYGQGYVHIGGTLRQSFRTIMAYSTQCVHTFGSECEQLARFSDANGYEAGVRIGNDSSNAVRAINGSNTATVMDANGACAYNLMNIFPGMERPGYRNGVNGWHTCPSREPARSRNGSYSRYFTFVARENLRYTIDLSSRDGNDTYLYIRLGGPYGSIVHQDDDTGPSTDARLSSVALTAGRAYTIEATTHSGGRDDEFVLWLATASTTPPPPPTNRCTLHNLGTVSAGGGTRARNGTLGSDCVSPNQPILDDGSGFHARFYRFTLGRAADVTIDMTSSNIDSYLVLRRGANIRGSRLASDDDGGRGTDARITQRLGAGTYTIEATSYSSGNTGAFRLTLTVATGTQPPPTQPGRTRPPTLDVTCHGYDEGPTRAYNCIPVASQQRLMRTFVPAVGSACDQGSIAEFPAGRIVFQIRCRDGRSGQSAGWSHAGRGRASFVKPVDTARVWLRASFSGSSAHLSVWCRAPQEYLVVNELLGASWGNDGTNGNYEMTGCHEVEVDAGGQDLLWWFTPEPAATALTPPRSWERVTGAGSALGAEALQDLAAAGELERDWGGAGQRRMNVGKGAFTAGDAVAGGSLEGVDTDAAEEPYFRNAVRTSPLTLDLTCHGYNEGAARGTRAYNCIPVPSQQRHMRTFVPPVGSACDRGSIAEFPAGRIVFQIRCRDGVRAQSAAWSESGRGAASLVKPADTPRVWLRTAFLGSSAHLSVWCRAPREQLVVNELLGSSWGNDGTNGIYGMEGCSEVEVDTGSAEEVGWSFTQELDATALWPPRSWERAAGAGGALPPEAYEDLDAAVELERLWPGP